MPDALLHFILFLRRAPVKSRPSQNPVKCQWLAVHVRLVFACFAWKCCTRLLDTRKV